MSKEASEQQEKFMSAVFRGKEVFKPIIQAELMKM